MPASQPAMMRGAKRGGHITTSVNKAVARQCCCYANAAFDACCQSAGSTGSAISKRERNPICSIDNLGQGDPWQWNRPPSLIEEESSQSECSYLSPYRAEGCISCRGLQKTQKGLPQASPVGSRRVCQLELKAWQGCGDLLWQERRKGKFIHSFIQEKVNCPYSEPSSEKRENIRRPATATALHCTRLIRALSSVTHSAVASTTMQ